MKKACSSRRSLLARIASRGGGALLGVALAATSLAGCGGSGGFSEPRVVVASGYEGIGARELAKRIAEGDGSDAARKALRAFGPEGLTAALDAYDSGRASSLSPDALARLSAAADVAAQQRDALHTRLYWYTDLDEAKRVAKAKHLPILSLRMLGHLDDELSCANSRFFRTTLYPDHGLNEALRKGFVLHWSSERPVPVVTIDYGDGRVVKRTITGNSIHYVLDPDGHVVDAIPGLYSASEFQRQLDAARTVALGGAPTEEERARQVADFHHTALAIVETRWVGDAQAVGYFGSPSPNAKPAGFAAAPMPVPGTNPNALLAIPVAPSKAAVEMPIARAFALELPREEEIDRVPWAKIGERLRPGVHVDDASRSIMREKAPLDWSTGHPRALDDASFEALVAKFETHVAEDMARNEYFFHAQIRRWIADDPTISLQRLNERVYAELFLTPANDPWLGLVPPVVYSGIQGDGLSPAH